MFFWVASRYFKVHDRQLIPFLEPSRSAQLPEKETGDWQLEAEEEERILFKSDFSGMVLLYT